MRGGTARGMAAARGGPIGRGTGRRASAAAGAAAKAAPRVVLVDNYDSFTYNLVQYLGELGVSVEVVENDAMTVEEIAKSKPDGVVVSPGPGRPEDSGISLEAVEKLGAQVPVFGVCMGHQCIGQAFGGNVIRTPSGLMHGKSSPVFHDNEGLFEGMANPFDAARYHSLCIERETLPDCLKVTAWTEDGSIMGVKHESLDVVGVQFHPESIITENGLAMLRNWTKRLGGGE